MAEKIMRIFSLNRNKIVFLQKMYWKYCIYQLKINNCNYVKSNRSRRW